MKNIVRMIGCAAFFTAALASCADKEEAEVVNVASIIIKDIPNDTLSLLKGAIHRLQIETVPPNSPVRFYNTSPDVFRIHQNTGEITALNGGAGTVIVVAPNGDSWTKAYCIVDVCELVEAITVKLDQRVQLLDSGETKDVKSFFTIVPSTASVKTCTYRSSDPSVATVDPETGVVTVQEGVKSTCEITAHATDGSNVTSEPILIYTGYSAKPFPHGEGETAWEATMSSVSFFSPANLIDNDLANYNFWNSNQAPPHYAQIDFKAALTLNEVQVHRPFALDATREIEIYIIPEDVTTEAGITWTDARYVLWGRISFGTEPGTLVTSKLFRTFPESVTTRYLMLKVTNGNAGDVHCLSEIVPRRID